jgi:predicted nucleic acid-binding protein
MNDYIIDSTIILGLIFLPPNKSKEIKRFFKKNSENLYTNEFVKFQISAFLIKEFDDQEMIENVTEGLNDLPLQFLKVNDVILSTARKISMTRKVNFFTATYHAEAISRNETFVTLDNDYYKKAKDLGNIKLI